MGESRRTPGAKRSPLDEVGEAMFTLLVSGPPRFPRIAQENDLTPPQMHLLRLLDPAGDGIAMRELAEMLFCDASNVTNIVDRLEERKLIKRSPDSADRRIKRIVLTKAGERLREKVMRQLYEPPEQLSRLSVAEQRQLRDLLRKAIDGESL